MTNKILLTREFLEPLVAKLQDYEIVKLWEYKDNLLPNNLKSDITAVATSVWDTMDEEKIKDLPNLKIISHMGVGYDTIDIVAAKKYKVYVAYTPKIIAPDTADIAFGLLIAVSRKIVQAHNYVVQGKWLEKNYPLCTKVSGKTIGIVGLGEIGLNVAKRALGFDMKILYNGPNKKNVDYKYYSNLKQMAQDCDYLVLTCPGNQSTHNLINLDILQALGKDSYLINAARGSVVKEDDLIFALQNNIIKGAALDVFANEPNVPKEYFELDNVIVQPHVGTATTETRDEMYTLVADNIKSVLNKNKVITGVFDL